MNQEHKTSTTIYAYEKDPTESVPPSVTGSVITDKPEDGYHNTASLVLNVNDRDYPRRISATMTAGEWETLAAAAALQAIILRGGVGR